MNFRHIIDRRIKPILDTAVAKICGFSYKEIVMARKPHSGKLDSAQVTDLLFSRLDEHDLNLIISMASSDDQNTLDQADVADRKRIYLCLGAAYGIESILQKTGILGVLPPDDVHAMSRGWLAPAGGYYCADLVVDVLESVGVKIASLTTLLDFGCSSGRVARVLRAAYPHLNLFGCDPNNDAINWAARNLKGIEFSVSTQEPPLRQYSEGQFDLGFAISIWTHFGKNAFLRWFDEMFRIIRPGGYLLLTTHGVGSIAHYAHNGQRSVHQLQKNLKRLYVDGFHFSEEFGENGDWGVKHEEWGISFVTLEWMMSQLSHQWSLQSFRVAQNDGNQDVLLLQRK
jgi:SAM-dependent methyltransferase